MWNLEKWYRWTGLQGKNWETDVENKHMDTKGGKWRWGDGGVMNWEIGIDMYTLMCIKLMTNKNLLYKKINKIKKLKKKSSKTNVPLTNGHHVFLLFQIVQEQQK